MGKSKLTPELVKLRDELLREIEIKQRSREAVSRLVDAAQGAVDSDGHPHALEDLKTALVPFRADSAKA